MKLKIISNNNTDSLIISDLNTNKTILKIPLSSEISTFNLDTKHTKLGIVRSSKGDHSYLISLRADKDLQLTISSDNEIISDNLSDSLLNFLHKSTNEFLATNGKFIFSTTRNDSLILLCQAHSLESIKTLSGFSNRLDKSDFDFLKTHASVKMYSFLFWFGRNYKKIERTDNFYDFARYINYTNEWFRTYPVNVLYKCEIDYIQINTSIISIDSFLSFIEEKIPNKDFSDLLKALYLSQLTEQSSYWNLHVSKLNSKVLANILIREKDNVYFSMIKKSAFSYLKAQNGEPAFNFTAEDKDGNKIKLSDYKNKIVFIEVWATWCGSCIPKRKKISQLSEKYKDNSEVEILHISINAKKQDWLTFLSAQSESNHNNDLIIENGMNSKFGMNYNIKSIPKFILIDKNGFINKSGSFDSINELEKLIDNILDN